jgi:hypothetical protein
MEIDSRDVSSVPGVRTVGLVIYRYPPNNFFQPRGTYKKVSMGSCTVSMVNCAQYGEE